MSKTREEDLFEGTTMTFGEHLDELRLALFRSVIGLVVGFLIGLLIAKFVVQWITVPLTRALAVHYEILSEERLVALYGANVSEDLKEFMSRERLLFEDIYLEREVLQRLAAGATGEAPAAAAESAAATASLPPPSNDFVKARIWRKADTEVRAMSSQEPFMIWLKAAFFSGLLIASPYIFWQLWSFVAAGLYPHEKRYVHLFLPISLALFWSGALLAFFFAFDYVLAFLFGFNRALNIQAELRISEWVGFVLFLPLGFGIAFQLPLVMFFLNRVGIFSIQAYIEKWRISILVIFVISMVLTPADPVSMLLMAFPLSLLYFLGIAMAKWMPRGRSPFVDAYDV
ncbi:MAG: twin-arginine translocase subunit TatC [Pirellulaceae bacterium]|jgi:sec-independent protein translocase protein TatC|nr:twin-arginine translocase subunit TatC [Pirellulaceae bacterium]